ncbi:MAG: DUF1257 domain-containing protein [Acidipila sp.]|nr:DUF1257 domain-containing protein [Acidipila sp.]
MSHYTEIKLNFTNVENLVEALVRCGIPREEIEVHAEAQPLIDWKGRKSRYYANDHANDTRFTDCDKAHVIIRRSYLGGGHNDLGFYIDKEKGSVGFVCDYARSSSSFNDKWMDNVAQRYAVSETVAEYASQGQSVIEQEHEGEVYVYVKVGQ